MTSELIHIGLGVYISKVVKTTLGGTEYEDYNILNKELITDGN